MLPVISLFSGAGGLDLGVEDAGATVRVMVEPDRDCVATLKANRRFFQDARILEMPLEALHGEEILAASRVRAGEVALVVGGPPCQPFSKSGYWLKERRKGMGDPRASLLDHFIRVVKCTKPEGFIMENVPSLTHPSHFRALDDFLARARRAGYSARFFLLHAVQYGVPQTRTRLFAVGLRSHCGRPELPPPTHWWGQEEEGLKEPETAGRWIAHLNDENADPQDRLQGTYAKLLREVPPGMNYKHHTAWAGHPRPKFEAETKYWSFLLKLSPTRPSWTIQASPGKWTGPFHWDSRRLRPQECAALQTFPSTFKFAGGAASVQRQIGNAVPCRLASRVAVSLLGQIAGTRVRSGRKLRYKLSEGFRFDPDTAPHSGHPW